jgi:hypothetical protein
MSTNASPPQAAAGVADPPAALWATCQAERTAGTLQFLRKAGQTRRLWLGIVVLVLVSGAVGLCCAAPTTPAADTEETCSSGGITTTTDTTTESESSTPSSWSSCQDQFHVDICQQLAQNHGCITDFPTMRHKCPQTCLLCSTKTLSKDNTDEPWLVPRIYNHPDTPYQRVEGPQRDEELRYLQDVDRYMYDTVYMFEEEDEEEEEEDDDDDDEEDEEEEEEFTAEVRIACQNRHELCTFWAMCKLLHQSLMD